MPNPPFEGGPRGTGRPNRILQADFAGASGGQAPQWVLVLETIVPLPDDKVEEVKTLLASRDPRDIEKLVQLLIANVPTGTFSAKDESQAKHMVAAAFGLEYP